MFYSTGFSLQGQTPSLDCKYKAWVEVTYSVDVGVDLTEFFDVGHLLLLQKFHLASKINR